MRRGARIIAGCAIGCVAVALAIAAILPDRFSAEAVLIVPSSTDANLGSVDQAAKLAGTYAQLIPRDTAILTAIGRALEMPSAAVEQRLSVAFKPGQSLLSLTFRGRSATEALRGARGAALTITSDDFTSESIRAGSMSIVRLPRTATFIGRKPFTHAAQSVLFVPPTPTVGGPGNAGEAANLATTYADLIPEDRVILQHVADRVGRDLDTVRARLAVTHDFDTSILRISFSDPDAEVALAGARVLADSVTGRRPVSTRIAPRSLSDRPRSHGSGEPIDAAEESRGVGHDVRADAGTRLGARPGTDSPPDRRSRDTQRGSRMRCIVSCGCVGSVQSAPCSTGGMASPARHRLASRCFRDRQRANRRRRTSPSTSRPVLSKTAVSQAPTRPGQSAAGRSYSRSAARQAALRLVNGWL